MTDYQTHQIPGDWLLRVVPARGKREARAEYQQADGTWYRAPLRVIAKNYAADEDPWPWLREHGVRRLSPSGPSGTSIPVTARHRKPVQITLSDEARAKLDVVAATYGGNRSAAIEALLLGR